MTHKTDVRDKSPSEVDHCYSRYETNMCNTLAMCLLLVFGTTLVVGVATHLVYVLNSGVGYNTSSVDDGSPGVFMILPDQLFSESLNTTIGPEFVNPELNDAIRVTVPPLTSQEPPKDQEKANSTMNKNVLIMFAVILLAMIAVHIIRFWNEEPPDHRMFPWVYETSDSEPDLGHDIELDDLPQSTTGAQDSERSL